LTSVIVSGTVIWSRIFLVTLAVTICIALAGCNDDQTNSTGTPAGLLPEQHSFDYHLVESLDAVRKWELVSAEMMKFADSDEVRLVSVEMKFFKDGEYFSTLIADSGQAHLGTHNLFVWGNVVVVTEDELRLETEELYYDNTTGWIHNEVFNRMYDKQDVSMGIGLKATPDLNHIEITDQLQAVIGDDAFGEDGAH